MPTTLKPTVAVCLESWHIGIAAAGIAAIQIVCTTICVAAVVVAMKHKPGKTVSQDIYPSL